MEPAHSRGIDLVVHSRFSLAKLAACLPHSYHPNDLTGRPITGFLVLNSLARNAKVDVEARALATQLESLRGVARQAWQRASRRVCDIGVQAGAALPAFEEVQLRPATLARLAALGLTVQVTVYPPEPDDWSQIPANAGRPRVRKRPRM